MCNTPITISNRSRRYTEGVSKRTFQVPCGHCHECQKRMQDDWFVRSFFEYRRVAKNGSAWFFTLTYTDENLPVYIDKDYVDPLTGECKPFARPCFSNKDLKRFRDRLRVYLSRAGYDIKDIRFFITCELGGKYGRPHYHPLLFLPFRIEFKKLFDILKKAWPLGRVGFSREYGMLVTSSRAVEYCCKYVSKESSWFRYFGLSDYFKYLYQQYKQGFDVSEKVKLFRRSYRLHFQSMRYGLDGLSCFIDGVNLSVSGKESLQDDKVNLSCYGYELGSDAKRSSFSIPSYYKRKLLYTKDSFNLDVKNEHFEEVAKLRFDDLVNAFERKLSVYFDYDKFCQHLQPLSLDTHTLMARFYELQELIVNKDVHVLSVYALVYSGLPLSTKNDESWPNPIIGVSPIHLRYQYTSTACLDLLLDKAKDVYCYSHRYERPVPDLKGMSRWDLDKQHFRDTHILSFDSLPCFHGFDDFLDLVSDYEHQLGNVKSESAFVKEDKDYEFALLTNVMENKYSFIYSKLYEL